MSEVVENKRAGREAELREKLKKAMQRYEDVFGKPLTVATLKMFLDESEKKNTLDFLKNRIGEPISDVDIEYMRSILKENVATPVNKSVSVDTSGIDELDDLNAPEEN